MLKETFDKMGWTKDFTVNHKTRAIYLYPNMEFGELSRAYTAPLTIVVAGAIMQNTFKVLHGVHSEPFAIIGANVPVSIERYATSLFGIIGRGAHLTAYTNSTSGMKIWVPRRSATVLTYPNCLDTTVAGGLPAGETPFECIVREANEEASLPEDLVKRDARACGALSYIGLSDERSGGEIGLIAPHILYVYDLELPEGMVCRKHDNEVEEFYLMPVEEVRDALFRGEFKTNCAFVMIDFFIRHGIITAENEKDYAEINSRLHRRLPLPIAPE